MPNTTTIVGVSVTAYCTREDLDNLFGKANVDAWADKDNDGDATKIANRIAWAIEYATAHFKNRMRHSMYSLSDIPADVQVRVEVSRKAGDALYSSRAVSDAEPGKDLLAIHRKMYEQFVKDVHSGRVFLDWPRAGKSYPSVVL